MVASNMCFSLIGLQTAAKIEKKTGQYTDQRFLFFVSPDDNNSEPDSKKRHNFYSDIALSKAYKNPYFVSWKNNPIGVFSKFPFVIRSNTIEF